MKIHAVLSNANHPEYGQVTVPFPIQRADYGHVLELLAPLELGDAVKQDCKVDEIRSDFPALKQMEQTLVNVDELDYLAKRLDSFADYEVEQFQAMANKLELHGVDELINLTFCAQEVTVITDFSKLDEVGKAHYLTMNGGCAPVSEVESLNGHALAADLIDHNVGYVTRFGVVYPNEMELSQIYKGRSFPTYCYEASLLEIEMVPKFEPEDTANITNFLLPMHPEQIERTMLRAGITNSDDSLDRRACRRSLSKHDVCLPTAGHSRWAHYKHHLQYTVGSYHSRLHADDAGAIQSVADTILSISPSR